IRSTLCAEAGADQSSADDATAHKSFAEKRGITSLPLSHAALPGAAAMGRECRAFPPKTRARVSRPALRSGRGRRRPPPARSEEHTSELQSLMRLSYAVF